MLNTYLTLEMTFRVLRGYMWIDNNLKLAIYVFSAVLSLILTVFFLVKSRKGPLLLSYLWLQSIVFFWSLHGILLDIFEMRYQAFAWLITWESYNYLYYIGYYNACFIGIALLVFCLFYTRFRQQYHKYIIPVLMVPPVFLFITFAVKNRLMPQLYGLSGVFSIIPVIQYIYCTLSLIILIKYILEQHGYARKQSLYILCALMIPLFLRAAQDYSLFVLNRGRLIANFDPTPLGFSVGMLIIAIAAFRYRFMDFIPIALRNLAGDLNQAIVVIDDASEILFYNNAFSKLCAPFNPVKKGQCITGFTASIQTCIENSDESVRVLSAINNKLSENYTGELVLKCSSRRYYAVDVKPLLYKNKEIIGKIVTFNNITEYKELVNEANARNNELIEKNRELAALNVQLEEYAATVKELTLEKERNRFARDVHDTLGHTMTVLITLLKVGSITIDKNPAETREKIMEALEVAKGGLNELRRSIKGLTPERLENNSIKNALDSLVKEFKSAGINVELTVDGMDNENGTIYLNAIFRICQEALTNALRHGKAKNVTIYVGVSNHHIKLFINDDGQGCSIINKGLGLSGMEQRVKDLDGIIQYGSDGENGFNIYVDIPLEHAVESKNTVEGQGLND